MLGIIREATSTKDKGLELSIELLNRQVVHVVLNSEERAVFRNFPGITSVSKLRGAMFDLKLNDTEFVPLVFCGWVEAESLRVAVSLSEPKEMDNIKLSFRSNLESADVAFYSAGGKSVGIERKSIQNLMSDMGLLGKTHSDGHSINEQLEKLIETYDVPIIMFERMPRVWIDDGGKLRSTVKVPWDGIPWDYCANYLLEWQLAGLYVEVTENIQHTVMRIDGLHEWFSKPEHGAISARARYIVADSGTVKGLNLLLGLDGFGEQLCRQVLEQTGTARAFLDMDSIKRSSLKGIGMRRATEVDAALDEIYKAKDKVVV